MNNFVGNYYSFSSFYLFFLILGSLIGEIESRHLFYHSNPKMDF